MSRRVVTLVAGGRSRSSSPDDLGSWSFGASPVKALGGRTRSAETSPCWLRQLGRHLTCPRWCLDRQMILITGTIPRSISLLGDRRNEHWSGTRPAWRVWGQDRDIAWLVWCAGRWAFRPTYWFRDSPAGLDRMADRNLALCESRRGPGLTGYGRKRPAWICSVQLSRHGHEHRVVG
jgi:hypothetical protein